MTTQARTTQQYNSSTLNISSKQLITQNPVTAATKAKEAHYNLDMMKRRLMVLQGQEDYHRYRTLDHEKRINKHQTIHQRMVKEKQGLRKSLEKVNDKTWVNKKCEEIREQLKQKLKDARKNLNEEKTDRTHQVVEESIENEAKMKEDMLKSYEENKLRRQSIQNQEELTRQTVSRQVNERIMKIRLNKSIDSETMVRRAGQGEQQLSRLVLYEQQLIKKNSQSLQASQVMKRKFAEVFIGSNKTKNSSYLPQIKPRSNNSKHTNSSDTPL